MSNDFQDALDAFKRDDCETAYKILLRLAEHDDPKAQFFLGALYFVMLSKGLGGQEDCEEAAKWFKLAAEQDYAEAQKLARDWMEKHE